MIVKSQDPVARMNVVFGTGFLDSEKVEVARSLGKSTQIVYIGDILDNHCQQLYWKRWFWILDGHGHGVWAKVVSALHGLGCPQLPEIYTDECGKALGALEERRLTTALLRLP